MTSVSNNNAASYSARNSAQTSNAFVGSNSNTLSNLLPSLRTTTLSFSNSCNYLCKELDTISSLTSTSSSLHSTLINRRTVLQTEIEKSKALNKHFTRPRVIQKAISQYNSTNSQQYDDPNNNNNNNNNPLIPHYIQCLQSLQFFKENPNYISTETSTKALITVWSQLVTHLSSHIHSTLQKGLTLTSSDVNQRKRTSITSCTVYVPSYNLKISPETVTLLRTLLKNESRMYDRDVFKGKEEERGFRVDGECMGMGEWVLDCYVGSR